MNDEMEKAERLFQQLNGNETNTGDDLSHLKVCFRGSELYCDDILSYLENLDPRVINVSTISGDGENYFYFVELSTFRIKYTAHRPSGYKLLDIPEWCAKLVSGKIDCTKSA